MDEKEKKEIEEIFKHHIGILSEDFQEKLDIVVEGHQLLNGKIDRLQEGQIDLTKRVDNIELITLRLEQRQQGLEQRQQGLERRQQGLEQRQQGLEQGQERLERRQSNLEQEIKKTREDLSHKIDAVASDLTAHRRDTEAHTSVYKVKEG